MATTLLAARLENTVFWKEDVKSRKKSFSSLDTYKSKLLGIKTQMTGLGNIKIKVDGLDKAKAELSKIKEQARKVVQQTQKQPKQSKSPSTPTTPAGKILGGDVTLFGPPKPTTAGVLRSQKADIKQAAEKQLKIQNEINAAKEREAKIVKFSLTPAMSALTERKRDAYLTSLRELDSMRKINAKMDQQKAIIRETNKLEKDRLKQLNKQNFAVQRTGASMRQLAGGAFSVFTLMQGIGAVAKTGMDFQAISNTMKAVSKDSTEMKENLQFIRGEARRLGADLVETSKSYSRVLAAGAGKVPLQDLRDLTSGVLETSAVLGLSADDTTGTLRALSQMLSKGKVTAEELTQQLGDRAPVAIGIFKEAAKEAGLITNTMNGEFEKLMANGKLTVEKILPQVAKGFHKWAAKGLPDALKSFRTELGRSKLDLQDFQDVLFGKGVEDGLVFLLKSFSALMKSSKALASFLGGAFKGAVIGITAPIRLAYAAIFEFTKLIGLHDLDGVNTAIKDFSQLAFVVLGLAANVWVLVKAFGALKFIGKLSKGFKGLLGKGGKDALSGSGAGGKPSKGSKGGLFSGMGMKVFVTNMPKGGLLDGGVDSGSPVKGNKLTKAEKLLKVANKAVIVGEVAAASYFAANILDSLFSNIKGYREADIAFTKAISTFGEGYRGTPSNYATGSLNNIGRQSSYQTQQMKIEVDLKSDMLDARIVTHAENVADDKLNELVNN